MSRYNPHFEAEPVFDTANQWKEKCLLGGGSLFTDHNLWGLNKIKKLLKNFNRNIDAEGTGFLGKLENQIKSSSVDEKLLASEIVFMLYLPSCNIKPITKLGYVNRIRQWANKEPIDANNLYIATEKLKGLGSGGPGYGNNLWQEFPYFLRFSEHFLKIRSNDKKHALISEGWKLAEWMDKTIPEEGNRQFRLMLLHMLFPDKFDRVFSYSTRRKIVIAFQKKIDTYNKSTLETDHLLYQIREDLEQKFGKQIDFFESPVREMWNKSSSGPSGVAEEPSSSPITTDTTTEVPTEAVNRIYYGPPGTGKTYLLNELKNEYEGRFKFVTFHQAYSYEDFVEGIRPHTDKSGSISYDVKPGVFRQICKDAASDSDNRYALFIDEINRGNIDKIFGDLITLIEPDKRLRAEHAMSVTLPYSNEEFGVPVNLNIYGAMNTADRSIALLDKALRRRFQFHELTPDSSLIKGSDGEGHIVDDEGGDIDLRELLDTMNKRIRYLLNRDLMLGHAYLYRVRKFHELKDVFVNQFIPLLQEYFYDDWRRIQLVFRDIDHDEKPVKPQIIKHKEVNSKEILGFGHDDFEDGIEYSIAENITAESIRKIYGALPN